jgi:hypothetical protein
MQKKKSQEKEGDKPGTLGRRRCLDQVVSVSAYLTQVPLPWGNLKGSHELGTDDPEG